MIKGILHKVRDFLADQSGPTAVEYAMLLALIIMVTLAGITAVGQTTAERFAEDAEAISQATGG